MKVLKDMIYTLTVVSSIITIVTCIVDVISLQVAVIIIVTVLLIAIATWYINMKHFRDSVKGRQKVIDFGHLLISQATSDVVMFGKDLSWAKDYYNLVKDLVKDNKEVKVYYVKSDIAKAIENAKTLEDAGAKVIPLKRDFGLRGTNNRP